VSTTTGAKVGEPEISEGSVETQELASTVSSDPKVVPDSAVNADLPDTGAQVQDVDKYCVKVPLSLFS
jgi:hypothetical protein